MIGRFKYNFETGEQVERVSGMKRNTGKRRVIQDLYQIAKYKFIFHYSFESCVQLISFD